MPSFEQNCIHLRAMRLVERISRSLKTLSWVWGGYTTDIYVGRMLREHNDLDYLTLDLHRLYSKIAAAFSKQEWRTKKLENGDLQVEKDRIKIHFGNVEFGELARWTHNGEKGSLCFPLSWLSRTAMPFYGVQIHVVAAELQYVLKEHPELLNPDWPIRDKDRLERAYLEELLRRKGIALCALHKLVKAR